VVLEGQNDPDRKSCTRLRWRNKSVLTEKGMRDRGTGKQKEHKFSGRRTQSDRTELCNETGRGGEQQRKGGMGGTN